MIEFPSCIEVLCPIVVQVIKQFTSYHSQHLSCYSGLNSVFFFLQTWAYAFQTSPELKEVCKQYQELKNKGVEFPPLDVEKATQAHIPAKVELFNSFIAVSFIRCHCQKANIQVK